MLFKFSSSILRTTYYLDNVGQGVSCKTSVILMHTVYCSWSNKTAVGFRRLTSKVPQTAQYK